MAGTPTTRYAIPTMAGTDFIADINEWTVSAMAAIDSKLTGYAEGVLASRPTSTSGSPGIAGRIYRATDNGRWYIDKGTGWDEIPTSSAVQRGKAIIPTTESTSSTSYTTLTTPDRVSGLVLPTDGLIAIAYQATWQESVAGAANAAIFVGSNQLRRGSGVGLLSLAASTGGATPALNTPLATVADGLASTPPPAGSYPGDVTTGQVVGVSATSSSRIGGGPVYVFAAAGTYDISVQFKASSGSVTASGRKLWAWVLAF